jgi:hypothetical protein
MVREQRRHALDQNGGLAAHHVADLELAVQRSRIKDSSENLQLDELQKEQRRQVLGQNGGNVARHVSDLELAVQRIRIIEADFDLVHSKYNSKTFETSPRPRLREAEVDGGALTLSKNLVAEIEQEILAELINKELCF